MNRYALYLLFGIMAVSLMYACKHNPDEIIPEPTDTTTPKDTTLVTGRPCSPDTVYYIRDIQPIFNSYCAGSGCHSGPSPEEGIDLTSWSKAIASGKIKPYNSSGSKVYEAILETDPNDRMPPTGNLSPDKIALIKKWIDQGAKNLTCDDIVKPCDTLNVKYSTTIKTIFADNCVSCHGSNGGVTLSNYNGVKTVVNNGKLWNSINHLSGASKAMPNSTTKLSSCNLRQIKIWIDAGAPQN